MVPFDYDSNTSDHPTTLIEAWFRQIEASRGTPEEQDVLLNPALDLDPMSRTPSPTKRQRTGDGTVDLDSTPRGPLAGLRDIRLGSAPSDSLSETTSSSRRTGSASPKKREEELRFAPDFPLHREQYSRMPNPTSLMRDLAKLSKTPVIPASVKDRMTRDSDWANPPDDRWFFDAPMPETDDRALDEYIYRRLDTIRKKTLKCHQRLEYEAGWNDVVHSSLLEVALDDHPADYIAWRNVTQCRIRPEFREPNRHLQDTKADYAILLEPAYSSKLDTRLRQYRQLDPYRHHATHINLSVDANTPVAIGIETKSKDDVAGPAQLVTFVRAQFRHIESLPNSSPLQLPIIPLIFVQGASWRIDFAERTEDRLIVWEKLHIGSSEDMHGCYCIVAALRRVARWCREEYLPWWEEALRPSSAS